MNVILRTNSYLCIDLEISCRRDVPPKDDFSESYSVGRKTGRNYTPFSLVAVRNEHMSNDLDSPPQWC